MSKDPSTQLVNLAQLRATGTRTVKVSVEIPGSGPLEIAVTERLDDSGKLDAELGRARLDGLNRTASLRGLNAEDESEEGKKAAEQAVLKATEGQLRDNWTWDARRIAVQAIVERFAGWNVEGLPIEFDALYDAEISTKVYQDVYAAVRAVPTVGKPSKTP